MGTIEGVIGWPLVQSGAPVNGTDEVQTITFGGTPTGGTFKLAFMGFITAAITWSATNNTLRDRVDAALEALPTIGAGGVATAVGTMTSGIGTLTVTFGGNLTRKAVPNITVADNSLTGTSPTLAVTETTPGVDATGRGTPIGQEIVDSVTGNRYMNTGTALAPTWTQQAAPSAEMAALEAAIPTVAVADLGAVTVGSALGAFTDPPSAAEMAALRTFVNALKVDAAADRAKINDLLAKLRTAGIITP